MEHKQRIKISNSKRSTNARRNNRDDDNAIFPKLVVILVLYLLFWIIHTFCFYITIDETRQEKNACYFIRTNPLCVYEYKSKGGPEFELDATPAAWIYDNRSQPLYGIIIEEKAANSPHSSPLFDYKVKKGDSLLIGSDNHQYVAAAVKDGALTYRGTLNFRTKAIYTFPNNVIDSMLENDDIDFIKFQHQSFTSKQKHPKTNEYVVREKGWEQFYIELGGELRLKKGFRMLKEQVEKKTSSQNR